MSTPQHYNLGDGHDGMDVLRGCMTRQEFVGFLKGNAVKYAIRLGRKGDPSDWITDAGKLADYATRYAEEIAR